MLLGKIPLVTQSGIKTFNFSIFFVVHLELCESQLKSEDQYVSGIHRADSATIQ